MVVVKVITDFERDSDSNGSSEGDNETDFERDSERMERDTNIFDILYEYII